MWPNSDKLRHPMYKLLLACCYFIISTLALANADTLLIDDLNKNLYFLDDKAETYLPILDAKGFDQKAVHFELINEGGQQARLGITTGFSATLFISDKLIGIIDDGPESWSVDSLHSIYGDRIHFTIYSENLELQHLDIRLFSIKDAEITKSPDGAVVLPHTRAQSNFKNFLSIALVTLAAILAALGNFYPKELMGFFRLSRAVALREVDEPLLNSRPLNKSNIQFYVFFSLLIGLLLVVIAVKAGLVITLRQSTGAWLYLWLQISMVVFAWLIFKFFMVANFTSLFNIRGFAHPHYFNYIRLGGIAAVAALGVAVIALYGWGVLDEMFYKKLFYLFLTALSIRSLIILLKLMNLGSHTFFHLFSYICATELIPLGCLVFLGVYQPF